MKYFIAALFALLISATAYADDHHRYENDHGYNNHNRPYAGYANTCYNGYVTQYGCIPMGVVIVEPRYRSNYYPRPYAYYPRGGYYQGGYYQGGCGSTNYRGGSIGIYNGQIAGSFEFGQSRSNCGQQQHRGGTVVIRP